MAKKCFFHLGFHKTASTYVQALIKINRDTALRHLHVVNRIGAETRPLKVSMAYVGKKRDNKDIRAGASAECARIIEQFEASGKDELLFSDESVIGTLLRSEGENGFYSCVEPRISIIAEQFAAYELHFVFYTREPAPWLGSLYNQAVKQTRFAGSIDDFLSGVDTADIWGTLHKRLSAVTQGRHLRFFAMEDDAATSFGMGDSLFGYVGLGEDERARMEKPRGRVNISWPEPALDLMRLLNASVLDETSLAVVRELVKDNLRLFKPQSPVSATQARTANVVGQSS